MLPSGSAVGVKVMEDVPTSSSFRSQQLNVLGEAVKSMPANMQAAVMPFVVGLMDLPYRKEVVEAIKAAAQQESPEAIEQRIKQAVDDALAKSGNELKAREVDGAVARPAVQGDYERRRLSPLGRAKQQDGPPLDEMIAARVG